MGENRKDELREDAVNEAIVLLLLLWAVLLLPGAVRSRNSSPHTTVGGFARAMDVLRAKPGQGRELMVPGDAGRIVTGLSNEPVERPAGSGGPARAEDPVIARRRSWFLRLLAATGLGLVLAVAVGGWLWLPFVMVALVTGGYVALLRHLKLQHDQARRVVADLELRRDGAPAEAHEPQRAVGDGLVAPSGDTAIGTVRLRRWDV